MPELNRDYLQGVITKFPCVENKGDNFRHHPTYGFAVISLTTQT